MQKTSSNRIPLLITGVSAIIIFALLFYSFSLGDYRSVHGLLFIPIVYACYHYKIKGFIFTLILIVLYIYLTLFFTQDPEIIMATLVKAISYFVVAGIVIIITSLHDKKDKTLLQDLQIYKTAVDQSVDGIAMVDINGNLRFVNDAWAKMHGVTKEEIMHKNLCEFPASQHLENLQHKDISLLENGFFDGEVEHTHKSGRKFPTLMSNTLLKGKNQEPIGMLWVMRDITRVKKAANELRESENRERVLTESAHDAIVMIDPQGKITYWNPGAQRIFGYQREEVLGENLHKLLAPEYYHVKIFNSFEKFQLSGEGVALGKTLELTCLHKSGREIFIDLSISAVKESDGWNAIGIMRDITHRKQVEMELKEAKEAAEAANRAKSEFLANMSHEIRTPMNAVLGFTKLLLSDKNLDATQRETLTNISSSSDLLLNIINDILDYSKIEAGKLELDEHPFNLDEILDYLKLIYINEIRAKGLDFFYDISADIPATIYGDSLRLSQIITNLLGNAVKFTQSGFIKIIVDQVWANQDECILRFEISDTGIGITEDQHKKLFKAFSQGDASTTRKFGGTGLGLVISNQLVELMSGKLQLESVPGQGSKFSFEIPFEIVSQRTTFSKVQLSQFSVLRALIVDDQVIERMALRRILNSWNMSVTEAASGREAIEAIIKADRESFPFNIILMDWKLPGEMDGIQAIREIRNLIRKRELSGVEPLIYLVSAYQKNGLDEEEDGFDAFLNKPVTASALFNSLTSALTSDQDTPQPNLEKTTIPDLSAYTILIADDNYLNQLVAVKWLERTGASIDVANDGREALQKSAEKDYDLILMDIQMPDIDGLEAAKLIHAQKPDLPIIALTAAVMESDVRESEQAGMSGMIKKPIDHKELFDTLSKCLTRNKKNMLQEDEKEKRDHPIPSNLKGFEINTGLKLLGGDEPFYKELLLEFKTQLDTQYSDLVRLVEEEDKRTPDQIHALKGISGTMAAVDLYETCVEIERQYKSSQSVAPALKQKLDQDLQIVKASLDLLREADTNPVKLPEISHQEGSQLIQEMITALERSEIIENEQLEKVSRYLTMQTGAESAQRLRDLIANYDYQNALNLLAKGDPHDQ